MRKIYSSIDIGSSFIKIVVLEELDKNLNVLANVSYPSKGIKDGMIVELKDAVTSLKEALAEINKSLGVKIDKEANNIKGEERIISAPDSKIKVMIVPTNEELMIARDTYEIVKKLK